MEEFTDDVPLYVRIAKDLRERIVTGAIPVGRKLPGINRLRTIYRCGFATAQRAVTLLRDEGYVATSPGRGTFVLSSNPRGNTREWRDVRGHLDQIHRRTATLHRIMDVLHHRNRPR